MGFFWRSAGLLSPYRAASPSKPFSLEVSVCLGAGVIRATFSLRGPTAILSLPAPTTAMRRDELWRHTCFEAFVQHAGGYLEYNLSPSTEWAAYGFTGYRDGMADLDVDAPAIRVTRDEHLLSVQADLALPAGIVPTRLGLSAVIEEGSGRRSYWALRHPPGEATDFHHPDCFALELPPPAAP